MTCLGKGATGFTSPSGSEMSAFLTSLRRYPVKNKEKSFLKHIKLFKNVSKFPNTKDQPFNDTRVIAKSNSVLLSSLNLIIKGLVNHRLHFIQLNLQPADISHDCRVTGSQFNSMRRSSVASCIPSIVPSQLCLYPVWAKIIVFPAQSLTTTQ